MTVDKQRLRVIQWATGTIGMHSLRGVIGHPGLELVGLHSHSADKIGRDAGDLAEIGTTGVVATDDVDALLALGADCLLYMPYAPDYDVIERFLAAGTNIVTTMGDFQNPNFVEPALRERIEAACRAGNSSIHSNGSSPGFITDALPLLLATMQRRFDGITVDEYSDVATRNSPDIIFGAMGFGRSPEETGPDVEAFMKHSRERSFHLLADAFGLPLDHVEAKAEIGLARDDVTIAAGVVKAGTVAGTRITISGIRNGKPLMRFRANWYCTRDMDVDWELIHSGWRIRTEGDTPMDVTITFPVPLEDYPFMSKGLTAHPAVNAVPGVCAAAPGICTSLDLPLIPPRFA